MTSYSLFLKRDRRHVVVAAFLPVIALCSTRSSLRYSYPHFDLRRNCTELHMILKVDGTELQDNVALEEAARGGGTVGGNHVDEGERFHDNDRR